ncbi:unnamed protein product [Caenorhabditis angaria]|uniref:protein-serine/threonine phosphatase n=1 Tax=Caenorhabditis angaria TaxID=860376 RepID=A0A9P1N313_9PELO|nr:unnamed protein product [Caenorhabditis angaria]
MSLVQVQRSPSPSVHDDSDIADFADLSRCSSRNRSMSECYFAVRGAAIILPHSEYSPTCSHSSESGAEIETHLQAMFHLLRPQDTLIMAVKLQTQVSDHSRYLTIVTTYTDSVYPEKRTLLIGMDYYKSQMTIGVVLPLLWCSRVELAGDGGVTVHGAGQACNEEDNTLIFRPTSVQAMWYVFQYLHKELDGTHVTKSEIKEPTRVTEFYMEKIASPTFLCSQWQQSRLDDDEEYGIYADNVRNYMGTQAVIDKENELRNELRQIMQSVDLDQVTSKDIRTALAKKLGESIDKHKEFIDHEMLVILGQLEKASEIFSYLLLGTEWNASNWDELHKKNVGFILNVTREVDNFFPQSFKYRKVWVIDEADAQLLNHWNSTSAFIKEAKESGKVCLVHCKKGISRSSSTVIAYIMKEYGWRLSDALEYVKKRRNCITPNKGFMEQLKMYAGALEASRNRHAPQFNSRSRAHSAVAPCRSRVRKSTSQVSASDSDVSAVRFIVNNFERQMSDSHQNNVTNKNTAKPTRHSFPVDIIKHGPASTIPQYS